MTVTMNPVTVAGLPGQNKPKIDVPESVWVEVRSSVRRSGPPRLVPLAEVHQHTGFRSVYAFDEATTNKIRQERHTSNMRGTAVFADTLFVDFDNCDGSGLIAHLTAEGIAFERWSSGGRSIHLHIPIVPVFGSWVPFAMKSWMRERAPEADLSFYHPSGVYRLPGTYHFKHPGRRKELIDVFEGRTLVLPEVDPEQFSVMELEEMGGTEDLFCLLTQHTGEGHRRPRAWKIATLAAESGVDFEEALVLMAWWNSRCCTPPHSSQVLHSQCEQAYRRVFRRQG